MPKDLTSIYGNLLVGMRDLGEWGVGGGHLDVDKLRLTIAGRREEAKRLVDAGMSQRQAAKALGVSQSTVRDDVSRNGAKSSRNSSTKAERQVVDEDEAPDTFDNKTIRERQQRALVFDCLARIGDMSRRTRKQFFAQLREKYGDDLGS